MAVAGLNAIPSIGNTYTPDNDAMLDKEDFLYLLVTQLQSQDPLNPMESTDFTAQLAQFSSLEQLRNVNASMEYLLLFESSINNAQAVSFIGKEITANGNATQVHNNVVDEMHFELHDDAQAVYINIYDNTGNLVRSLETGEMNAGQQSYAWDGRDDSGHTVDNGVYSFEVFAVDELDQKVPLTTFTKGTATSVVLKDNATYVVAGEIEVPIGSIIEITEPKGF